MSVTFTATGRRKKAIARP